MGATASTKSQLLRLRQRATLLHALQAQNMPLDAYVYLHSTTLLRHTRVRMATTAFLLVAHASSLCEVGWHAGILFLWMRMYTSTVPRFMPLGGVVMLMCV
jgi:hypothetical protein